VVEDKVCNVDKLPASGAFRRLSSFGLRQSRGWQACLARSTNRPLLRQDQFSLEWIAISYSACLQKSDTPVTKDLRAAAKQRAQTETLNEGTTPAF
jgi:hypothetical protein